MARAISSKPRKRRARRAHRYTRLAAEALESRTLLAGDITTGLVHYWTFDETSGDIAHDSAGVSDAALVGWNSSEPKWEAGRVGGALDFSDAGSYVIAASTPMSGSFAVSFWLNDEQPLGPNARIFTPKAGNIIFVNHESNRGVSFLSDAAVDFSNAAFTPSLPLFNVWEHYVVNYNAVTKQGVIYRNGSPVAIAAYNEFPQLGSWVIGHSEDLSNNDQTLHGALDELRIYNRVLSDDDIALLASQGAPAPTHQEPVHHWTFDETSGYTAHDSASDADGILLNWNTSEPRWEPGQLGGALAFTTADDAVVTPPVATGAQWSVAFWVNVMAPTGTNPRIVEPWAYINFDSQQGMGFSYGSSGTFDSTQVVIGRWQHYAITFDASLGTGTIYRNGVAVKSGFIGGNSPAFQLVFGHNHDLSNPNDSLHGLLDDLRIYDRVITPAEIQQLATTVSPPRPSQGLVHEWTFDETSGNTAHDSVGGNDATLLNWGASENKWVSGHIGGAVSFSDADDLMITSAPIDERQYTITFWLETAGPGGTNPRIAAPIGTLYDWVLINREINKGVGFYYRGSTAFGPTAPAQGTWDHYAVVADQAAGTAKVYRNGTLVVSGSFNDVPALQQWVFGHNSDVTNHTDSLSGLLDDLRIYDRLLTAGEVQRLASGQPLLPTNDAYSTKEDMPLDVPAASGVLANDSDLDGGATAIVDTGPAHGALVLNPNGSFHYTPDADFNGSDSFTYRMTGRDGNYVVATVGLTVAAVNDAPQFTKGPDQSVTDELPLISEPRNISFDGLSDHLGDGDPFSDYTEGAFTVSPTGGRWLIMTTNSPTPGIAGNPEPSIWEDTYNASLDVTRSSGGSFAFTSIDLFGGKITYTLTGLLAGQTVYSTTGILPLGAASGFVTIESPSSDTIDELQIAIVRTNSEASNVDNIRLSVPAPSVSIPGWATKIAPGPPTATDETGQLLAFTVTNDNNGLFLDQPAIDATGTLRFTPAPNVHGTAVVTVTLHDDGGTANGGIDASSPHTFSITITKPHLWHNALSGLDVTNDGNVAPNDALAIINYLNAFGSQVVPQNTSTGSLYYDVSADNDVAPNDALAVINFLNSASSTPVNATPAATFEGFDTTTQGNWQAKYGADGYELATGPASMPSYALVSHGATYVWESSTTDPRALEKPGAADRLAACWNNNYGGFVIDVNLTGNQSHRVALYLLDWDGGGSRSEQVEVMDASNDQVLDTRLSGTFDKGEYLVWNLSGHVEIRITSLTGNAVVSGIFFG